MKYHYTYRITNKILKKHYYGVRTSKDKPELDLGIKYFSSSSDSDFIKDQNCNIQNYRYKILKVFKNRSDAGVMEIKLHEKFNVSANESFYNKCNSTSQMFTIEGLKHSDKTKSKMRNSKLGKPGPNKGVKFSKEHKQALSEAQKKRTDDRSISEETKKKIAEANRGRKQSEETKKKRSESLKGRIISEEAKKKLSTPKERVMCTVCGKIGGKPVMKRYHFEKCKEGQRCSV